VVDESATALLGRARSGDGAAWDALVARYTNLVWSVARAHRLDTADAADVVQTTWLRLIENMNRIHDPERLPGWLTTTAARECLRTIRRAKRTQLGGGDDAALDVEDVDAAPLDAGLLLEERDASLWRVFGQLPERCRRLLRVLMADDRASYAEIAEALGIPIGSIGPTRGRCLDRLRELARDAGLSLAGAEAGGLA
jgi:RNA polymerase sigma factor (sigma-70 family)